MRAILLIMIGFSILNADFTKNGNIVTDNNSKLQWQDNEVGSRTTWQGAIDRCESLILDGQSDWRLPNINELKSIVDRSKVYPAIVTGFVNTSSSYFYWSSTTYESNKYYAWIVYFYNGHVGNDVKDNGYYVRCVRDGQ